MTGPDCGTDADAHSSTRDIWQVHFLFGTKDAQGSLTPLVHRSFSGVIQSSCVG